MLNIVTVVRDDLTGLKRTISSICSQDLTLIRRVLILDGNSTDGTWEYIQELNDPRFVVYQAPPSGVYPALNSAMAKLFELNPPGDDHLLFLNAGDFFANSKSVTVMYNLFNGHQFSCFATFMLDTRDFPHALLPNPNLGHGDSYMNPCVFWLPHQGIVVSIDVSRAIGEYSTEFMIASDYDWILKVFDLVGPPRLFTNREVIQMIDGISNTSAYLGYQERIEIARQRGLQVISLNRLLVLKMRLREVASRYGLLKSANKEMFDIIGEEKDQLVGESPWRSYFEFTSHAL
jgi:glycosyltransferase involved in cell wall biosynthesis